MFVPSKRANGANVPLARRFDEHRCDFEECVSRGTLRNERPLRGVQNEMQFSGAGNG